ncbi:creatininase family protein [Deinococcus detaillensis]|uniref:Creatininase family protein n=2 Tax=Deinococcus detaillensis TaxID=2592048 RepID=A0A553UNP2_9DEIO|nr:creatininase family protein [Deinococcus detaillensis]
MNWMQVEEYLKSDNRCILPLGSTEQHAHLSLCVDNILPSKLAHDAVGGSGVPVFPVLPYGVTPYFRAYPGSINIRVQTYLAIVRDILDDLHEQGFRRILIVNGHGGNTPAQGFTAEWMADHPGTQVKFHNWWNAPQVWAKVQATDSNASHASWMENFPWTRLDGVEMPDTEKTGVDFDYMRLLGPAALREYLGEGNFGGKFQRPDADMQAIWDVAVAETRAMLEKGWAE